MSAVMPLVPPATAVTAVTAPTPHRFARSTSARPAPATTNVPPGTFVAMGPAVPLSAAGATSPRVAMPIRATSGPAVRELASTPRRQTTSRRQAAIPPVRSAARATAAPMANGATTSIAARQWARARPGSAVRSTRGAGNPSPASAARALIAAMNSASTWRTMRTIVETVASNARPVTSASMAHVWPPAGKTSACRAATRLIVATSPARTCAMTTITAARAGTSVPARARSAQQATAAVPARAWPA